MELIINISEERYKEIVESDKPVMIYRSDVAKVLVNGTPLEKIRDEIKEERKVEHIPEDVEKWDYIRALDRTLSIIDKYKTESEESDADSD